MTNKKHTGSYYTPDYLSDFIVSRISMQLPPCNCLNILEPSVGDGSFLNALNKSCVFNRYDTVRITAFDICKNSLDQADKIPLDAKCLKMFEHGDFLHYTEQEKNQFDLIIGNPPYIKKNYLLEEQIAICKNIHQEAELSNHSIKNIWTAFLIKSIQLLKNNGVLAFVLPAELMQVKFAEELRTYIQAQFQKIEIYTFSDLHFECKGQDTIILLGFKASNEQGVFYTNIESKEQMNVPLTLNKKDSLEKTNVKWTHHMLDSDDLDFLFKIRKQLHPVSSYCDSKPGIVTAANHFFIVDKETEEKYELGAYTKPIIQKGLFANGSIVFDDDDYCQLISEGKPARVLCFKDEDITHLNKHVLSYLKIGKDAAIPERYKCRKRDNWYVIPNITKPAEGFFFKRCHRYPKLIKNQAKVLVTDSAYLINMYEGYEINQLIYSFYNSLTLAFTELEGRYYGGGVLELTPNEFKNLPIPISSINNKEFESFRESFEKKSQIEDVLIKNDFPILNTVIGLNTEEIAIIRKIHAKLIQKRLK